ncbi:MAG TPA: hypothetical protein PLJ00_16685 [Chitinophagales bacterium]|nr:hypothetical protein [Chitinophagales bacterium]HRG29538.1 hypothetical protein [Chitinophagales bacterium]
MPELLHNAYLLVSGLNKSELQYVTSQIKKLPKRYQQTDGFRLFFTIVDIKQYNEEEIRYKWWRKAGIKKDKRFINAAQKEMIDFVSENLIKYNKLSKDFHYEKSLMIGTVLAKRKIYNAAYYYYKESLEALSVSDQPYNRAHVLHQMFIVFPHIQIPNKNLELRNLIQIEKEIVKDISLFYKAFRLFMHYVPLIVKQVIPQGEKERNKIKEILNLDVLKQDYTGASLFTIIYINKLLSMAHKVLGNIEERLYYQQIIIQQLNLERKLVLKHIPALYIQEIFDFADASLSSNKFSDANLAIIDGETLLNNLEENTIEKKAICLHLKLSLALKQKNSKLVASHLDSLNSYYQTESNNINNNFKTAFLFSMLKGSYFIKDYKLLNITYNAINQLNKEFMLDIFKIASLIYLAATYEQFERHHNNLNITMPNIFINAVQKSKPLFRENKYKYRLTIIIFKHIARLSESNKIIEHNTIFTNLNNELETINEKELIFKTQLLSIWDYNSWIKEILLKLKI